MSMTLAINPYEALDQEQQVKKLYEQEFQTFLDIAYGKNGQGGNAEQALMYFSTTCYQTDMLYQGSQTTVLASLQSVDGLLNTDLAQCQKDFQAMSALPPPASGYALPQPVIDFTNSLYQLWKDTANYFVNPLPSYNNPGDPTQPAFNDPTIYNSIVQDGDVFCNAMTDFANGTFPGTSGYTNLENSIWTQAYYAYASADSIDGDGGVQLKTLTDAFSQMSAVINQLASQTNTNLTFDQQQMNSEYGTMDNIYNMLIKFITFIVSKTNN